MSTKPKILRVGSISYAHDLWEALKKDATVIDMPLRPDYGRAEFIKDLDTNPDYQDIAIITRDLETKRYVGLFDEELVSHFPKLLKLILIRAAGYDQVDVSSLTKRGIIMSNTPNLVNDATADTHVYLMLAALRNFQMAHYNLIKGNWPKSGGGLGAGTPVGKDIEGKVVGILGNGKIGRTIIKRLKPFGVKEFVYHNRHQLPQDLEGGARYVSFDELCKVSDVISINVPLNAGTKHIINKDSISKMKDEVVIVNTARGPVIDEEALIEGLKSGKVFAAGLDVFEGEPYNVNQELISLPNVVSLPHMGTHTKETIAAMEEFIVGNIKEFLKNGKPKTIVPEQQNVF